MSNKYRKKAVEIEALRFTRRNWKDIVEFTNGKVSNLVIERRIDGLAYCDISTLEGVMKATEHDFIIKGVKGEFYPCKPDVFEMTYEKVE